MTEATTRQRVVQSDGTKEDFQNAKHNFLTSLHTHWKESDHNDMEVLKYYCAADVSVTNASSKYDSAELAGLKDADKVHADKRGYEILNLMMARGSPAVTIIQTGARNGSIPIGSGFRLFQHMCDEWSLLDADTTDTNKLALDLASKKMVPDEDAGTFIRDFNTIVDKLRNKDPPQIFPDVFLIQRMAAALDPRFEKIIDLAIEGAYSTPSELHTAVRKHEKVLSNKSIFGLGNDTAGAAAAGDNAAAGTKKKKKKKKRADDSNAAAAHEKGGGKGKGNGRGRGRNRANLQCFTCWEWDHISPECPTQSSSNAAAAGGE